MGGFQQKGSEWQLPTQIQLWCHFGFSMWKFVSLKEPPAKTATEQLSEVYCGEEQKCGLGQ